MPLQFQLFTAAVLALTGIAVALLYDIYRGARRAFRWRGLAGELADLAFWAVAAVVLVLGLIAGSWGSVRWHGLLMIGAGAAAYFALAAPLVSPVWRRGWELLLGGARRAGGWVRAAAGRLGLDRLVRMVRPPWTGWRWPGPTET